MAAIASVACAAPVARSAPVARATRGVAPARAFFSGRVLRSAAVKVQAPKKFAVRAESEGFDSEKAIKDLSEKWDAVENKSTVAVYGAGAIAALWFSSTIVGAINAVPLLPKLMELVGLGYTAWFVYRYLLFKSSREELISDVDELKKKITGPEQ